MPNPVTVILKDEDGVDHTHTTQKGVRLNKQGGGTQDFYLAEGTALLTDTTSVDVRDKANAQIDAANISGLEANNIKTGATILGVVGSYAGIIPSGKKLITDENETDVTSYATAQIDTANVANLSAGNIKKNISILGITGNYEGGGSVLDLHEQNLSGTVQTRQFTSQNPSASADAASLAVSGTYTLPSGYKIDHVCGSYGSTMVPFDSYGWSMDPFYWPFPFSVSYNNQTDPVVATYTYSTAKATQDFGSQLNRRYTNGSLVLMWDLTIHYYKAGSAVSGKKLITDQNEVSVAEYSTAQIDTANVTNLTAGNIKKDISILGVTGTYEGGGSSAKYLELLGHTITNITSAEIASASQELVPFMFAGLENITSLSIPAGMATNGIPDFCFAHCGASSITFADSINWIGRQAFASSGITSITLDPGTTISECEELFPNCANLTRVTFNVSGQDEPIVLWGSSMASMFSGCSSLEELIMNDLVQNMVDSGDYSGMFFGCSAIEEIVLNFYTKSSPSSINMDSTFAYCRSLTNVTLVDISVVPTTGPNTFLTVPSNCVFHVPSALVSAFQADSAWGQFTIVAIT